MKMVKPVKGSLEINYSGKNGIKGNDGFNAIHNGDSGSNGLSGSNGQNGLPINVNLHVENGKIIVMENNCFGHSFRLGERDNKLLLISSGGDGGEGGLGGDGGASGGSLGQPTGRPAGGERASRRGLVH